MPGGRGGIRCVYLRRAVTTDCRGCRFRDRPLRIRPRTTLPIIWGVYPPPSKRRCQVMTDRGPVHFDAKRDMGVARQVPLEAFRRFDNDVRISHGQGADQRSRNLAKHAQRQQMMYDWIAVHGSDDQRERLSAGVLPFKEFVDALTEVTFRPLSQLTPYETDGAARMQEQIRQLPGHADAIVTRTDVSVVTRLLPTASAIQWSLVNEIRSVIPDAQV